MEENKKGPFRTITHKGSSVYIYRTPTVKKGKAYSSYTLSYTRAGHRIRKTVAKLDKALASAKTIAEQLSEGTGHAVALTPEEIADYTAALKILRKHPDSSLASICQQFVDASDRLEGYGSILDAVSTHVAAAKKKILPEITPEKLVSLLMAAKQEEKLAPFYLIDLENRLKRFAKDFRCSMASIQPHEISNWLPKQATGRNANNLRASLGTLFSFARKRGYLPRQEKHAVELTDKLNEKPSEITIYSPSDLQKILAICPRDLLPAIAIAAFTGMRSTEIFRLDWSDVKRNLKVIEVKAKKAKTQSRRPVPINPALEAWLRDFKATEGKVAPEYQRMNNFTRKFAALCKKANVIPQRNGFRHSYASYQLMIVKSADQVALDMGTSKEKIFANYRDLVSKEDAKAWFAIRPPQKIKKPVPSPTPATSSSKGRA
jgi:integrase